MQVKTSKIELQKYLQVIKAAIEGTPLGKSFPITSATAKNLIMKC